MGITIVYGKSGSGKSNYIYNNIKENSNQKVFLIVPEQCNLSAEVKLLEHLDTDSLINIEVLTLKRMADRVIKEVKGNYTRISKTQKNLIIYNCLKKMKNDLNFFNKNERNIEIISELITEFKKHNIKVSDLENANIEDQYTDLKIRDAKLIYKYYQEKIEKDCIDENDDLTILSECLIQSKLFENSYIYFDEFDGFTPQEFKVFEQLAKKARETVISICLDDINVSKKESDIFYFNKLFANKILKYANENNILIRTEEVNLNKKFKNGEIVELEKKLRDINNTQYESYPENVEINLMDNPYSEIEYIAKQIILLAKQGYRYKNMAIISGNLEDYSKIAKMVFLKYNIPLHIDNKKRLIDNVLVKYILLILEIFSSNWSFNSMMNYLKLGLLEIEEQDIFDFENYCKTWGIDHNRFLNCFEYEKYNANQERLEELRKSIINPLNELKKNISEEKDIETITSRIVEFLNENKIVEILNKKIEKINDIQIKNEYNTAYKLLMEVFDNIVLVFGKEKTSYEKYKEIFEIAIKSEELGIIPATQDQVIFGEIEKVKVDNIDVCFVLGVNDGVIPKPITSEGFLNDKDREILKDSGIELAKDSLDTLYEKEYYIYKTLTIPSSKLIISYCSSDSLGTSLRPSIMIKKIIDIFPKINIKSNIINKNGVVLDEKNTFEEAIQEYINYLNKESISDEWKSIISYYKNNRKKEWNDRLNALNYDNNADKISPHNIEKMYNKELKTSISKLEEYRKCPFSYHMKYGLNLKEPKEFKIQVLDTGIFMHELIDTFFYEIEEKNIDIKTIEDNIINDLVEKIINDMLDLSKYYIFTSTPKFRNLTRRLKKVVLESIHYIIYTIKNSSFNVLGHEVEFGKDKQYKPIRFEDENGHVIELSGKVDRIDVGKIDNREILRIIDYKSSVKNIDLNKIINGIDIQLITYADAISKQREAEIAGMLYMGLIENIVKSKSNKTDEEIEKEVKKNFKMQGIIVADIKTIKMMDNTINCGKSDIIPVELNKEEDKINGKNSSTLTRVEFDSLQKETNKIIKQIGKEILGGNINITPYYYNKHTGCEYCKYKAICLFDPSIKNNNYNFIKKLPKEEILEKIKNS